MTDDEKASAMEFTKAASATLRRRWRDRQRSLAFWRAWALGIGLGVVVTLSAQLWGAVLLLLRERL